MYIVSGNTSKQNHTFVAVGFHLKKEGEELFGFSTGHNYLESLI